MSKINNNYCITKMKPFCNDINIEHFESATITQVSNIGTFQGRFMTGGSVPITGQATINGTIVYFVIDGTYTKMIDISGNACFYTGTFNDFRLSEYSSYVNQNGNYILCVNSNIGTMSGDYISVPIPISGIGKVNGKTVYFAYDNTPSSGSSTGYVKMVDSDGIAKYYVGNFSSFNPNSWSTYNSVNDG